MVLARKINDDADWLWLYVNIQCCLDDVYEFQPARSQMKKYFIDMAKSARLLADHVDIQWSGLLAIELYPEDVRTALGVEPSTLSFSERERWPTMVSLLRRLEIEALKSSRDAMREDRLVLRVKKSNRGSIPPNVRAFIRALAVSFRERFGISLSGTTAVISNVIFQRQDITGRYVERVSRKRKHRKP